MGIPPVLPYDLLNFPLLPITSHSIKAFMTKVVYVKLGREEGFYPFGTVAIYTY